MDSEPAANRLVIVIPESTQVPFVHCMHSKQASQQGKLVCTRMCTRVQVANLEVQVVSCLLSSFRLSALRKTEGPEGCSRLHLQIVILLNHFRHFGVRLLVLT